MIDTTAVPQFTPGPNAHSAPAPHNTHRHLRIWQWNANGYPFKKAVLQQRLQALPPEDRPDVILLQETHSEATPTLTGYHSYASPPSARENSKGTAQGVCTFVRKGLQYVEHSLLPRSAIEYCVVELLVGRKKHKESIFLANVYSNPRHYQQRFRAFLHKLHDITSDNTTLICGDFNAPHQLLGYTRTTAKGRLLLEEAADTGYHLLNDTTQPTRQGTSVQRDTNPDLAFHRPAPNAALGTWRNSEQALGSDHFIIELLIPTRGAHIARKPKEHRVPAWDAFRRLLDHNPYEDEGITDIQDWTQHIRAATAQSETTVETSDAIQHLDSRLTRLIEAQQSLKRRWRQQRTNRNLRKRIAQINREIEKHCAYLCRQQWHAICQQTDGQMHTSRAWRLLKHLLDPEQAKSTQSLQLARTLQLAAQDRGDGPLRTYLNTKYLPITPTDTPLSYHGHENTELDGDIQEWEVTAALQSLNCRSAAGPDGITNKMLRNLPNAEVSRLTEYYNRCWQQGTLPQQWKHSKTILIPKPGKPAHIDHLRPISLTSCVGKVLEHVLYARWNRYLEAKGLYPNTMLGFRAKLATQDAMLLIKKEIVDTTTLSRDSKAILGLDLQGAFDNVKHTAILQQVSALHMGRRSFNYIQAFLSKRTVTIHAGDIELPTKELGSTGTPQGSVISPLLFNLVMIPVAQALASLPAISHTIYADDITIWCARGSDGQIEERLQDAVRAVEASLDGTGLRCSPAKSELLVLPTPGHSRRKTSTPPNIWLHTAEGGTIPHVQQLRILGLHIQANRSNSYTVNKLTTKLAAASALIRKISTRHAGMREANTLRLLQSFAVSHVAYVAPYHNWQTAERERLNAAIRKAYREALGLYKHTSNERLLQLGVHNTLEEIAEAQLSTQISRLSQTRTGKAILHQAALHPRPYQPLDPAPLPPQVLQYINVAPIPRNMHPEANKERRQARARALSRLYDTTPGAVYVDAAAYPNNHHRYVTVAVAATNGTTTASASVRARDAAHAEELAIALALTDPSTTLILSDSQTALRRYATNSLERSTRDLIQRAAGTRTLPVRLVWFPAHVHGPSGGHASRNRNVEADRTARSLTSRAALAPMHLPADPRPGHAHSHADAAELTPLEDYGRILQWYRDNRRKYPGPHPNLTRKEAVLYRHIQTDTVLTPALARHLCPTLYNSHICNVCHNAPGTLKHIITCPTHSPQASTTDQLLRTAVSSSDYYTQSRAVQQVAAALERQRRNGDGPRAVPDDP